MAAKLTSAKELTGLRVVGSKKSRKDPEATHKIGRVRACVFHPSEKRFVGVMVKRPDAALMFHRKDLFVAYNGYDMVDGRLLVHDEPEATDKAACKAMGVEWDDCVLWVGLSVVAQDGTDLGAVGDVVFDCETGSVEMLEVSAGATANALLGKREIPADLIRGFRKGIGSALASSFDEETEERICGAILVSNEAKLLATEGGLAEKAGEATAVAGSKAHEAVDNVVKPAAHAAGEAVNKGAYATGRQLKRAKGMFADFKDEYDKASGRKPAAAAADAEFAGDAASLPAERDVEVVYVDEDGNVVDSVEEVEEVVYVDEDGNEIVYVDEDGNEIVYVDEDEALEESDAGKATPSSSEEAARAVGRHLKKAGGMFSAFKEEYDKARR